MFSLELREQIHMIWLNSFQSAQRSLVGCSPRGREELDMTE